MCACFDNRNSCHVNKAMKCILRERDTKQERKRGREEEIDRRVERGGRGKERNRHLS